MVFSKRVDSLRADGTDPGDTAAADTVLIVVNLDPHAPRETTVRLDMPALGLGWEDSFEVTDEITGATYAWGKQNYVRLDPAVEPAHVFAVRARS